MAYDGRKPTVALLADEGQRDGWGKGSASIYDPLARLWWAVDVDYETPVWLAVLEVQRLSEARGEARSGLKKAAGVMKWS